MTKESPTPSRRKFVKQSGATLATTACLTQLGKSVHAASNHTIQLALVGCGGRGTGAAKNALSVPGRNTKLVAMADVFENRLGSSYRVLSRQHVDQVTVPDDQKFIGFEAYKQAMDCLNPGDIVMLTTPPAFRWVQFQYAIERGLHVFMEKPVTVDAPTSLRMLELGKKAAAKNLKVAVGLMCRHCEARGELFDRIQNGEIGDILLLRAYRMTGPTASAASEPKPDGMSELQFQIKRFHSFLWASGGAFSDFLIHNIDECCWMKDAWPVEAIASGGRHYRNTSIDQNFDTYSVEYTFADGTKLMLDGRTQPGCHREFASFAHGSKSCATISASSHSPSKCRIYTGQNFNKREIAWQFDRPEPQPYQLEWNDFMTAIREDQPYSELERGVMASAVTSMGRMAAHTGQRITFKEFMECEHEFAPNVDKLTLDGPAPLQANAEGKYPVPMPGLVTETEYAQI